MSTEVKGVEEIKGALYQSLNRNNKEIKADRAEAIGEDLEMTYSRGVQDIARKLKRLSRERDAMFDLSPTNTQSLILASELHADDILAKDQNYSIQMRQVEIELDIAQKRYEYLFGKTVAV